MSSNDMATPPQLNAPPRRSKLAAAMLLLLVFVGGLVAGAIGDRIVLMKRDRIIPIGGIEFLSRHLVHRLDRSLDLTDAQEAEVRNILDRRKQILYSEWDKLHLRFHQEFVAASDEIEAVLTPEQVEEFQSMRRRWEEHGGRGRGPATAPD